MNLQLLQAAINGMKQALENSITTAIFGERHCANGLQAKEALIRSQRLILPTYEWTAVMGEAMRLSQARVELEGHRVLDILHVAAALKSGATVFLSFDVRQRTLAAAEGLTAGP